MEDLRFSYKKAWEDDGKIRKGNIFSGHLVKVINLETVEKIIKWYMDNGGEVVELSEGCLGYGRIICTGVKDYPSILIKERFLNEWSSDYYFRCINKLSKKLLKEMEKATGYYETWYAK